MSYSLLSQQNDPSTHHDHDAAGDFYMSRDVTPSLGSSSPSFEGDGSLNFVQPQASAQRVGSRLVSECSAETDDEEGAILIGRQQASKIGREQPLRDVGLGKLYVSLFYNRSSSTLRVNVIQWVNAGSICLKHAVSPYVKVSLLYVPTSETETPTTPTTTATTETETTTTPTTTATTETTTETTETTTETPTIILTTATEEDEYIIYNISAKDNETTAETLEETETRNRGSTDIRDDITNKNSENELPTPDSGNESLTTNNNQGSKSLEVKTFLTKTKGKENPIFDEEFSFGIGPKDDLKEMVLMLSVCDFDKFSRQVGDRNNVWFCFPAHFQIVSIGRNIRSILIFQQILTIFFAFVINFSQPNS